MKKTWVQDLELNSEITDYYFVSEFHRKVTKSNKPYLVLILRDRTGQVEGRMWSDNIKNLVIEEAAKWAFVKLQATVSEYRGETQLTITKMRPATEEEYDPADFFPHSKISPDEMWADLLGLVDAHAPDAYYWNVIRYALEQVQGQYKLAPAGKSKHHAYYGGLLEHSLSMAKACVYISDHYGLNKSLMVAAAVLHDIGKTSELTYEIGKGFGYSLPGSLIGHVAIGLDMVARMTTEVESSIIFPDPANHRKRVELLHMVASHHGLLEYGSPKVPLMREAIAFHLVDMIDSKLAICDAALSGDRGAGEFTDWVSDLGGPLLKPMPRDPEVGTFYPPSPTPPVIMFPGQALDEVSAEESGLGAFPKDPHLQAENLSLTPGSTGNQEAQWFEKNGLEPRPQMFGEDTKE